MKRKKKIAVLFLALAIIIIAALVYTVKNAPVSEESSFLLKENSDEYEVIKYKNGFLTYDGKLITFYNSRMEQGWILETDDHNEELSVNGEYILAVSKDSNNIKLIKDGKALCDFTSDKDIRTACVNSNGFATVLTSDSGYKGQCSVYDKNGIRIARYSYGKKYIISAYLASDNKSLFMSIVDESENMFKGKLTFLNIKDGSDAVEIETEEIAPFTAMLQNSLLVSTVSALSLYDKNGKIKWSYDYDGGKAEYIKCSDSTVTVVLQTKAGIGSTEVLTFNAGGKLKGRYLSDIPIDAFDTSSGYSAVKIGNEIKLLNKYGKITSFVECNENTFDIKLYKNENRVLVISGSAEMKRFGR